MRLDAVDKPATRRRWLITKGEGAPTMDPKVLEQAALALMENLSKDAGAEGLAMSEASLGAVNGLAKSLGLTTAFKAKAAPPAPPPAAPPMPPKPEEDPMACRMAKFEEGLASITKSVGELVTKMVTPAPAPTPAAAPAAAPIAKSIDGAPVVTPPSTQPRSMTEGRRAEVPELGKGVFTNIVFAEPSAGQR